MPLEFEWDAAKEASNLAKHRVSFEEAIAVFADPEFVTIATTRVADSEERFKAIGRIADRIFTVVYTYRGVARRIISARRANAAEERNYGHDSTQL